MARTAWVLATVILAVGVGLWVNFWLPWWAGAAIGFPIACVFLLYAIDDISGVLSPTPAGALEISRWWAFKGSLREGLVSPSLDPSQPDPMLPYAVALNQARQWINDINAVPPWFLPDGPGNRPDRASMAPTAVSSAPTLGIWTEAQISNPCPLREAVAVAVPAVTAAAKSSHPLPDRPPRRRLSPLFVGLVVLYFLIQPSDIGSKRYGPPRA